MFSPDRDPKRDRTPHRPTPARRRRRIMLVAVISLTGIGILIGAFAQESHAIWPFDALFSTPTRSERAVALLAEAISIPTVNPPGDEGRLARRLAAELGRAGIEHRLIPTPGSDGSDRAAVWGRLLGTGQRPGLILLSHLDTVPANASDWSVDPFAGRVWDGYVWGRGALDAKSVTIAHLLALLELAASDQPLDRDIIFLATPDEETGGLLGAGWIVEQYPDLIDGAGYLLTEGGGIESTPSIELDRPQVWSVSLIEKAPCWLELRAFGPAGHSSAPDPRAAVPRLIAALDRIRRVESRIRVLDEVAEMFARLAPLAPEWDRDGFRDLATGLATESAFRRRFLGEPGQNALVRNTISITVLEGAPNTNVAPAMARAQLDARLLPGERCDAFAESISVLIDDRSIEVEEILSFPSQGSTPQSPLYRAIEDVAGRQPHGTIVIPRMIGGFTDAHWFRTLGIVAYGFVPRALAREEARRVHGLDERISIETLDRSIELTIEIARRLDELDRSSPRRTDNGSNSSSD